MTLSESRLTKGEGDILWYTPNYSLSVAEGGVGYTITNAHTNAVELFVDQEPSAILGMLWLEDEYTSVMGDPEGEFRVRRARRQQVGVPAGKGGQLIQ